MNIRLFLARIYIPSSMKKKRLQALFKLTSLAFQTDMPAVGGVSFKSSLKMYALFTKAAAERVLEQGGEIEGAKARLYQNANAFGRQIRRDLRLGSFPEVMEAAHLLYRLIGIDFHCDASGGIIIKKCSFSRFYSPQVCGLVSSLDEGILAGLAGGGNLTFARRMTEGGDCCLARFVTEERPS